MANIAKIANIRAKAQALDKAGIKPEEVATVVAKAAAFDKVGGDVDKLADKLEAFNDYAYAMDSEGVGDLNVDIASVRLHDMETLMKMHPTTCLKLMNAAHKYAQSISLKTDLIHEVDHFINAVHNDPSGLGSSHYGPVGRGGTTYGKLVAAVDKTLASDGSEWGWHEMIDG